MDGTELITLGVPTLHEANHRRGLMRSMWLVVGDAFAGPAQTVAIPAGDNLGVHLALEGAEAGAVLCVSSGGHGLYGVIGELIVEAARIRGLAALVIDDGVRDVERLSSPPVIAALRICSRGTIKRRAVSLGAPVAVDGLLVRPGDWVIGDRNGVCVLPAGSVDETAAAARARVEREETLRAEIRRGVPTTRVLGLRDERRLDHHADR
ncbi:MAG TPA: RraA family protein [Candidatus Dormibacteraeota bacterium]|nr:RraA family protein [Candidatus Dormibacteraeota bacterium]